MIVIFASRSDKKALETVRKVLDNYANRIGNDTWMSVMTEEGLSVVKSTLRKHVSKGMAVACHKTAGRNKTELLWIVGNRHLFNERGEVPVATTQKDLTKANWENNWLYMPMLKAIVAVSLLLHDLGKSSDFFQDKLRKNSKRGDPFRHEWVSCKLIEALVYTAHAEEKDDIWLDALANGKYHSQELQEYLNQQETNELGILKKLPPVAALLCWMIISHHRLPLPDKEICISYKDNNTKRSTFDAMMKSIKASWSYEHTKDYTEKEKRQCFTFSKGILFENCQSWNKMVKKWAKRLSTNANELKGMAANKPGAFRALLSYARLCMMLSDHYCSSSFYVSSAKDNGRWFHNDLWANTNIKGDKNQFLEEHLYLTARQGLSIAHSLPGFADKMEHAYDIKTLEKKSPSKFSWQDKAVNAIKAYREKNEGNLSWFIVNMASTGCGKTIANAKIERAVSKDGESLRYILALGLRSLTLQTGDSYKKDLGLDSDELAVLVGNSAVRSLHKLQNAEESEFSSESAEELLTENVSYSDTISEGENQFLDIFFDEKNPSAGKAKAFLYKPVLCTTIDHMMGSVCSVRGGKYILPMLRLMSSDLIIDEIDDFAPTDLLAIARLVHLAGMLGRNVGISSATIPQDLAEALYRAYAAGLRSYNEFFSGKQICSVLWCDEYSSMATRMNLQDDSQYKENHKAFLSKRVKRILKEPVKRKGTIWDCDDLEEYGEKMQEAILTLHNHHHIIDKKTGKQVSFGLVRLANITPCVNTAKYLMNTDWPEDVEVRVLPYHSRQILLMRYMEEKYLDHVLRRKYDDSIPVEITDPVVRSQLDKSNKPHFLFILVATPVEEVGRDHDFDWAVVEPSSYRSIIQLSGRIRRHRPIDTDIVYDNLAVMEYNVNALKGRKIAYTKPGFEAKNYPLKSHNMHIIGDEKVLNSKIDSTPRIQKRSKLEYSKNMIDLEQKVMEDINSHASGPDKLLGWTDEYWWMTGVPLYLNRFRKQYGINITLYALYKDGEVSFNEVIENKYEKCEQSYNITIDNDLTELEEKRLWLPRSYIEALKKIVSLNSDLTMEDASKKYGELDIEVRDSDKIPPHRIYSDLFGLYNEEE